MGKKQRAGVAVDSSGGPVVDPTANVLQLVQAQVIRLDDLREKDDDLRQKEAAHFRELMALRDQHATELRVAESARLDAIRTVDVNAAAILATQSAETAETLRNQVEAARVQTATTLATALAPINQNIEELRRYQYEGLGGKAQVVEARSAAEDLKPVLDRLDTLTDVMQRGRGASTQRAESGLTQRAWITIAIAAAAVLSSVLLGAAAIVVTLLLRR